MYIEKVKQSLHSTASTIERSVEAIVVTFHTHSARYKRIAGWLQDTIMLKVYRIDCARARG